MPRKGEALIIDSMPAMAQFVFDLYNTKLEQIKSSMPVSIHYLVCNLIYLLECSVSFEVLYTLQLKQRWLSLNLKFIVKIVA